MSKSVELDTFLMTLKVPRDLPASTVSRIRRILNRPAFQSRLRRTIEALFHRYSTLQTVTLSISR